jgi:hypothetical protein
MTWIVSCKQVGQRQFAPAFSTTAITCGSSKHQQWVSPARTPHSKAVLHLAQRAKGRSPLSFRQFCGVASVIAVFFLPLSQKIKSPTSHLSGRYGSRWKRLDKASCSHSYLLKPRRDSSSMLKQASWLSSTLDHSCGTALDFHQLPPLRPSIRAGGSLQRYSVDNAFTL